jgi:hypothetical protein
MPKVIEKISKEGNVAHDGGEADWIPSMATVPIFSLREALDERFESLKTIY